jgi:hypothetical protein
MAQRVGLMGFLRFWAKNLQKVEQIVGGQVGWRRPPTGRHR